MGNGLTHGVARAGTVAVTRKAILVRRPIALANVPPAPVVTEPALLLPAKMEIFAPPTPCRFSSSLPLRSTEFLTVVRPCRVRRIVRTFAFSDSDDGMVTTDCVSTAAAGFGVVPLTSHGVITDRQRYAPAERGLVSTPALSTALMSTILVPLGE